MPRPMTRPDFDTLYHRATAAAIAWLERVRAPDLPLGHFRFCRTSKHPWTLYASNCALSLYNRLGLTDSLSAAQKRQWADVFLRYYHADLGLFICPQLYGPTFRGVPESREDRIEAGATAPFKKVAAKLFDLVGHMPPTPDEGTLDCDRTDRLRALFDEQRRTQNAYRFGATLGGFFQRRTRWLRGRGTAVAGDPWIEWGYAYVDEVLDPDSGLLTASTGGRALEMNGLFKLCCGSYWNHARPVPHARRVIDGVLQLLDPDSGFGAACEDFNATKLLAALCRQEGGYRAADALARMRGPLLARLEQRRRDDGGFSFHTDHCLTHINSYFISAPEPVSDLLGTGQQLNILEDLQSLNQLS